jgi:hypothetical protein
MSVTYSACTVGKGDPPLLACPCQAPPSPEKPPPPTTGPHTCTITGNGVNYRTGPKTSDPSKGTYNSGNSVGFLCRTTGELIDGNSYVILIISFTFALSRCPPPGPGLQYAELITATGIKPLQEIMYHRYTLMSHVQVRVPLYLFILTSLASAYTHIYHR